MHKLLEKLMSEKFEDTFKPISDDEAEERQIYDEDEMLDYFMSAPSEYAIKVYGDYVGPLNSVIAHDLLEELPDEVLHKIYMSKVKGVDEKNYEYDAKEIHQWAKEEWKKRNQAKPTDESVKEDKDFKDNFKPIDPDELLRRIEDVDVDEMKDSDELWEYLVNLEIERLLSLYYNTAPKTQPIEYSIARKIIEHGSDEKIKELYMKALTDNE